MTKIDEAIDKLHNFCFKCEGFTKCHLRCSRYNAELKHSIRDHLVKKVKERNLDRTQVRRRLSSRHPRNHRNADIQLLVKFSTSLKKARDR